MPKRFCFVGLLGLVVFVGQSAWTADRKNTEAEEKALQKRADEFIAAFNRSDAAAVAAFWTPDGDYVDQAGTILSGRHAIEAAFQKHFAAKKGGELRIKITALRFVKPDLAIEDGTAEVAYPDDAPPIATRFTAVHIKQQGRWYLACVRDAIAVPPSNHEHLRDLDWLTGDWIDEAEKGEVGIVSFSWAENDNFLVASFATTLKKVPVAGGTQWVGWDGADKQVRSWGFYSDGSISEGTWRGDGNKWTAKMTMTMRDGKKLSAMNILTRVDADHATWQSTKRTLDGKELPDTDLVKMKRAK
jgi:uncharacterized protein (TIGR02246 family)